MDYPPCPYPPRVPGDGIPVGETRLPQKPPNAECATACPQEDALTGLDWHRPSGTLIHSPHQINNVSAESCVLSSLNLPQPTRFSPPEVALPSSPERKEIVLVSSASTFTGDEDSISVSLQSNGLASYDKEFNLRSVHQHINFFLQGDRR